MTTKRELLPLTTGVTLETAVVYPPPGSHSTRAVFCLHPWSWLGGCMDDPVIQSIVKLFARHNCYVVYYNSRGVGGSTGYPSFTGRQEGEDLQALVQQFLQKEAHITAVTIVGYSHGSLIATLHPTLISVKTSYVLLSYPLSPRGLLTLFHSGVYSTALDSLLCQSRASVLVIYGERDNFTSRTKYDVWTRSLRKASEGKAKLEVVSVAEADHFWRSGSARTTLKQTLEDWLCGTKP
ncbi:Alpha/Beta hydrolase protein [Pisolithus marmoratus]|nr:Alpha/Beta hydrolase protein [Pisolithus marmoratus]